MTELKNFAAAFLKAKEEIGPASESGVNTHFRSTYPTLLDVFNAVEKPLARQGIVILQVPIQSDREFGCRTTLYHAESGESISADLSYPLVESNPQRAGSALTYAKRQALMTMCGISSQSEDDDAGKASASFSQRAEKPRNDARGATIQEGGIAPTLNETALHDYSTALLECLESKDKAGFLQLRQEIPNEDYLLIFDKWTAQKRGLAKSYEKDQTKGEQ